MAIGRDKLYRVDRKDPVAQFVRTRLGWDWPGLWLATFLLYGPIEKLVVPWLGGYLSLHGPVKDWVPDVEALLTGFVEFPIFYAYYLWTGGGIGQVFDSLARTGVFPEGARYELFWSKARTSLNRKAWSACTAAVAVLVMAVFQFVLWAPGAKPEPWFELDQHRRLIARSLSILMIGGTAYAVFQILLREFLTLRWLSRLWEELGDSLVVHPYHPDGAGGLGAVGQHALRLSMFLLVLLLFLVMGGILPSLRTGVVAFSFWSPWLTVCFVFYLVVVAIVVFPLVLSPHRYMCAARGTELTDLSKRLDRLFAEQKSALEGGGDQFDSVAKQIKQCKEVRSQVIEDFPQWPFSRELKVKLGLTSLPAVLLPGVNYLLGKGFSLLVQTFRG